MLSQLTRSYKHWRSASTQAQLEAQPPLAVRRAFLEIDSETYELFIRDTVSEPHRTAYETMAKYEPAGLTDAMAHVSYAVAQARCDLIEAWVQREPFMVAIGSCIGSLLEKSQFTSIMTWVLEQARLSPKCVYSALRQTRSLLLVPYVDWRVRALAEGSPEVRDWLREHLG